MNTPLVCACVLSAVFVCARCQVERTNARGRARKKCVFDFHILGRCLRSSMESGVAGRPRHLPSHPKAVCPVVGTESHLLGAITHLACVNSDDVFVDIGCGDGRLLVHAADRCGCKCVGFDVRPSCVEDTMQAAAAAGVSHLVTAVECDMMDESFANLPQWQSATVVYAYLLPDVTLRIAPLLHRAVQDGKIVLLYCSSGSRIRRANARPAGNIIGDLIPAAQAVQGKLRLYARPGVLSSRGAEELACVHPHLSSSAVVPLPLARQWPNAPTPQARTLPLPSTAISGSQHPIQHIHRSPTEYSSLLSHTPLTRPTTSSLTTSASQAALLASRERLARLMASRDEPQHAENRLVSALKVQTRDAIQSGAPLTLAAARQIPKLHQQLEHRSEPSTSSLTTSASQAALLASRERLARLLAAAEEPQEEAEDRLVSPLKVQTRIDAIRTGAPLTTLAPTRQIPQLHQQLEHRSNPLPLALPLGRLGPLNSVPLPAGPPRARIIVPQLAPLPVACIS
jgi:hypothetical protein